MELFGFVGVADGFIAGCRVVVGVVAVSGNVLVGEGGGFIVVGEMGGSEIVGGFEVVIAIVGED